MKVIRGAINLQNNSKKEVDKNTKKLMREILKNEKLNENEIHSIIVSVTDDITKKNPCSVIRHMGFDNTALMGVQEMKMENGLPLTIRLLIHAKGNNETKFYYLNDANKLRSFREK